MHNTPDSTNKTAMATLRSTWRSVTDKPLRLADTGTLPFFAKMHRILIQAYHTRPPFATQHWHTGCKSDAPFGAPLRRVLFTCQIGDDPSAKRRRILHNEPLLPGVYIYTFPHKWQINSAYLSKYFAIKSSTVCQYSVGATEDESAWPAPSTVSSSFSQAAAAYNSPSILYGTSSSDEP